MEQVDLQFKGRISSDIRVQLLDLLKSTASMHTGFRSDLKKLIGVALELLDNAQRYGLDDKVDFMWRMDNDSVLVMIRNKAGTANAHRLLEVVDSIASMSQEEISQAFMRQLTNNEFSGEGGAGLGMLQIARKVGGSITAEIEPVMDDAFMCTSTVRTELMQIPRRA